MPVNPISRPIQNRCEFPLCQTCEFNSPFTFPRRAHNEHKILVVTRITATKPSHRCLQHYRFVAHVPVSTADGRHNYHSRTAWEFLSYGIKFSDDLLDHLAADFGQALLPSQVQIAERILVEAELIENVVWRSRKWYGFSTP